MGSISKQRMREKPSARPLSPEEVAELRQLLQAARSVVEIDQYLDGPEAARLLGLCTRTVRDLANAGAFDGEWGVSWKPAHNRIKIPRRGVDAYIRQRPASGRAFSVQTPAQQEAAA